MPGYVPGDVTFTSRATNATVLLEPLTARKRTDGFWLFNSGQADGTMFAKNVDGFQLLTGLVAFGASQRMGQREIDDFVLVIGDNT